MVKKIRAKLSQLSRVSRLAPDLKERIHFILWFFWLAIRHRVGFIHGRPGKLKLQYKGKDFEFYANYSTDIAVLDEIFINRIYEFEDHIKPKVIFDIGSNTGVSVKFFNLKFPDASIFAFEPDSQVFQSLKLNTANMSGAQALNLAVTAQDGFVAFYAHPKSPIVSSLMPRFKEQKRIDVEAKSLDTITKELGITNIDLIKFDVEGAEREIFSSFDTRRIKMLVGELHVDLAGMSLEEFKQLFPDHEISHTRISPIRYNVFARKKA